MRAERFLQELLLLSLILESQRIILILMPIFGTEVSAFPILEHFSVDVSTGMILLMKINNPMIMGILRMVPMLQELFEQFEITT